MKTKPAKPASYTCPHCGCQQDQPLRPPIGTRVSHPQRSEGVIFSYDQCDEMACGVDYGGDQWCEALRDLTISP